MQVCRNQTYIKGVLDSSDIPNTLRHNSSLLESIVNWNNQGDICSVGESSRKAELSNENKEDSSPRVSEEMDERAVGSSRSTSHPKVNCTLQLVGVEKAVCVDQSCEMNLAFNNGFMELTVPQSMITSSSLVVQGGFYPEFLTGNESLSPIACDSAKARCVFISPIKTKEDLSFVKQGPSNFNTNLEQEHAEILHFETNSKFTYWPVCRAWQEEKCQLFGLLFVRGNQAHVTKSSVYSLDHPPQVVARITADGNCFFRAISHALTGCQREHYEVRVMITSYMLHHASILLAYLRNGQSMEEYMEESKMQSLKVWATEIEIYGAANMLETTIFTYAPCGSKCKWLKFEPKEITRGSFSAHSREAIYISNVHNHFEPVKRMDVKGR